MERKTLLVVVLVALFAAQYAYVHRPTPAVKGIDRITYVYEKDDGAVPPVVTFALRQWNGKGIMATVFEVDNEGEQYELAKTAAKAAGLPCLVVQSGLRVVKVVKNPTTEADVQKAVN